MNIYIYYICIYLDQYIHKPSGKLTYLWEITILNGKTHVISMGMAFIAMSKYERV